jgi:hypothetical protein
MYLAGVVIIPFPVPFSNRTEAVRLLSGGTSESPGHHVHRWRHGGPAFPNAHLSHPAIFREPQPVRERNGCESAVAMCENHTVFSALAHRHGW